MSHTLSLSVNAQLGGKSFPLSKSLTGELQQLIDAAPAAAKIGTLTTRTDNDTGTFTMNAGHGFATSDKIDVYWTDAGVKGARYGMTATVTGNSVVLDGGAGANLPTQGIAITAMKQITEDFRFDGNDLKALVIYVQAQAAVRLESSGPTVELVKSFIEEGVYYWYPTLPDTNPVTGDVIIQASFSHGDSSGAKAIKIGVLAD